MSAAHEFIHSAASEHPPFLDVTPGMTVIVRHDYLTGERKASDWLMGQVIHCGGAARDPSIHNLFQIADVDSGEIRWVNADLVTHILLEPPDPAARTIESPCSHPCQDTVDRAGTPDNRQQSNAGIF